MIKLRFFTIGATRKAQFLLWLTNKISSENLSVSGYRQPMYQLWKTALLITYLPTRLTPLLSPHSANVFWSWATMWPTLAQEMWAEQSAWASEPSCALRWTPKPEAAMPGQHSPLPWAPLGGALASTSHLLHRCWTRYPHGPLSHTHWRGQGGMLFITAGMPGLSWLVN